MTDIRRRAHRFVHLAASAVLTAIALLQQPAPARAQNEAIDLFDPSISACSGADDDAWYYQVFGGSDQRCQVGDIRATLVSQIWGCTSGDCSAVTAASGDSIDAGSADSSKPATRSTSLPGACAEGQLHQDTDSGGSETYLCDATNTWRKLAIGGLLDSKTSATTVVNTTTETAIYSYTIPAGTVRANDALRLFLLGSYYNDSAAGRTLRVRVKLAGATVLDWTSPSHADTNTFRWRYDVAVYVQAMGATNSQTVAAEFRFAGSSAGGTWNTAGYGVGSQLETIATGRSSATADMTAAADLVVTVEHSATSLSLEYRSEAGTLELLAR